LTTNFKDFKNINTARLDLASLLVSKKRFDEAVKLYEQAKASANGAVLQEILYHISECYTGLEKQGKTLAVLESLIKTEPRKGVWRIAGLVNLAQIYEQAERWNETIEIYKEIASIAGSEPVGQAAKAKLDLIITHLRGSAGSKK
jgi:lipopolysaccharide biosynthesis regulator YciM